jgi:ribosomal protein L37AE/L43A
MDVMSSSNNSTNSKVKEFVNKLAKDYPSINFRPGKQEHWSPKTNTITYNLSQPSKQFNFSLLHELAHALLEHNTYITDFELLKLESQAWELASRLGKKYGVKIDDDHIQNCLDTYRDWLHRRSACPTCGTHVLQRDVKNYQCFNCQTIWQVSSGRFVRPYRRLVKA